MIDWKGGALLVDTLPLKWRALLLSVTLLILIGLSFWLIDAMLATHQMQLGKLRMLPEQGRQDQEKMVARIDAGSSEEIKQLKQQIEQTGRRLDSLKYTRLDYIRESRGSEQVRHTVNSLLRANARLTLIRLESLPAKPLLPAETEQNAATETESHGAVETPAFSERLYQHGIHLTVRGRYFDLLDYLEQLENGSLQIFWHGLELKVETYPYSTLSLHLFTVSRETP